jgi:hypothetical protein
LSPSIQFSSLFFHHDYTMSCTIRSYHLSSLNSIIIIIN